MIPRPLLPAGTVHLHLLRFPEAPEELARLKTVLSPAETARACRLKSVAAANRCVASRGLLRELLGGYLGVAAGAVPLVTSGTGKPHLLPGSSDLQFSLAHAGPFFLLAVTRECAIGVDLERVDPEKPLEPMADMIFSPAEKAQWRQLAAAQRTAAFYWFWVRKEACLKGSGAGFTLPARTIDLSALDRRAAAGVTAGTPRWRVLEVAAPSGYCAALALEWRGEGEPEPQLVWVDRGAAGE